MSGETLRCPPLSGVEGFICQPLRLQAGLRLHQTCQMNSKSQTDFREMQVFLKFSSGQCAGHNSAAVLLGVGGRLSAPSGSRDDTQAHIL